MRIIFGRIKNGRLFLGGESSNPLEALEWAKQRNMELNNSDVAINSCHCGLADPGTELEGYGTIKETYHTTENLVTIVL